MAFDKVTITDISTVAKAHNFEPAALLAVAEVESAGQAFALVNGRYEPLIRFEGHYFDKRLTPAQRKIARTAGLSSPTAGKIANPKSQSGRWDLLNRAMEIDAQAAMESVSWGLGQVMGAHWKLLGFASVTEMVNRCRSGAAGQAELMARFIEKTNLAGALQSRNWAAFAKGYNGPAYARNAYDSKMAKAYAKYAGKVSPAAGAATERVRKLQELLTAAGFPTAIDGISGPNTIAAVKAFQRSNGLAVDGIAGPATWTALEAASAPSPATQAPESATTPAQSAKPAPESPIPPPEPENRLVTLLKAALQALVALFKKGS